jgi:hypothetical protein
MYLPNCSSFVKFDMCQTLLFGTTDSLVVAGGCQYVYRPLEMIWLSNLRYDVGWLNET